MHGMKDGNDTPIVGHFVGIDNSPAMVDACKKKLEWAKHIHNVQMSCGDILNVDINNASIVIMNYIPFNSYQLSYGRVYCER